MSIKKIIIEFCNSLCLTQQELAREIGISESSITKYMQGLYNPKAPIIRKFIKLAKKRKIRVPSVEEFKT